MRRPLLVLLLLAACEPPVEGEGPMKAKVPDAARARPARKVQVLTLAPQPFTETVEVTATVQAPNDATLSAQSAGTVRSRADVGTLVKDGEVVARLDAAVAEASLAQTQAQVAAAESALALARDTLKRQKPLFEREVISALEFNNLEARVNQAAAQLRQAEALQAQAKKQVELTRVVAPFAGRVEQVFTEPGEQVAPGMPVLRLLDISAVKVRAGVPERYAPDIRPDAALEVVLDAYGMETRKAKPSFVGSTIDDRSRTFPVEVELANEGGALKPGMSARLRVVRASVAKALVVPQTAVLTDGEGESVFLAVERDGKRVAERRDIQPGARARGSVVVVDGLAVGDQVVVKGQADLTPGAPLEVSEAP